MREINVLIFPCGSEIGLEYHRALRYAKEITLFGGSSVPDHGRFVYENYISDIPFVSNPEFLKRINEIVCENKIDYLIPAHDSVVLALAEAHGAGALSCPVLTSPVETCRIARSKQKTLDVFKGILRTPKLYPHLDDVDTYPVFLKPDVGQGGKGTALAQSRDDAIFYRQRDPSLLIMEYLPGIEYTIDCYTNQRGDLIFWGARERQRISNGISVHAKPVYLPEIGDLAQTINQKLMLRGGWFFQLKTSRQGELALLEIAPRLAGTMGMYRNLGINFALMSIYEREGYTVKALKNTYALEMDRALGSKVHLDIHFKHVYVDLDDSLIIKQQVNTQLIAFLYQCLNENIRLILLTRHAGDLTARLHQYRLASLFDEVIHIQQGQKKSAYIQAQDAIFIDDSFAERSEVQASCNIPVFALDAVESLLKA